LRNAFSSGYAVLLGLLFEVPKASVTRLLSSPRRAAAATNNRKGKPMFVRWNHYKRQDGATYWNAALVEAVVQTKRRPRQRHMVALGGIAETDAHNDVAACHAFWTEALKRLSVRKLSKADRQKIETALEARVRRPTDEQLRRSLEFIHLT
jgi:hypothetical protein